MIKHPLTDIGRLEEIRNKDYYKVPRVNNNYLTCFQKFSEHLILEILRQVMLKYFVVWKSCWRFNFIGGYINARKRND